MKNMRVKDGFTLIEVMVVVAILSVLTTIAFVNLSRVQAESRDKQRQSSAVVLSEALEKYYDKNGEYPSVVSIVGQPAATVKTKLKLNDTTVLVMPRAAVGTTNSLTATEAAIDKLAYNGSSANASEESQCQSSLTGGCDEFRLEWKDEKGDLQSIQSRRSGRTGTIMPSAPTTPSMTVSFSSPNVIGTAADSTCDPGSTLEYKILYVTNTTGVEPVSWPAWSTVSWQSTTTRSVAATQGNFYYFKALAHCTNQAGTVDSEESNVDSYFYATAGAPTTTAVFSGADIAVNVTASSACGGGLTAKYRIDQKIDTTAATGAWTTVNNYTTTSTYTYTGGTSSNPRKFSYRGYVRCDNGATPGTPNGPSSTVSVTSAPTVPTLTKDASGTSGSANTVTWSWTSPACPVGTTLQFYRQWTGDYTNAGTGTSTTSTSVALTTSSQGYQYGMYVRASCGAPVTNVTLSSAYSTNVTYIRNVTSEVWVYKGSIRTRRPDPSGTPNTVFAQSIVHESRNVDFNGGWNSPTPNQEYPAIGSCASGLTRKIRWQWALDATGTSNWGYNDTSGAVDNGAYSPESTWANGTSKVLPTGSVNSDFTGIGMRDLDANPNYTTTTGNNSKVEFAFQTRCVNDATGRAGAYNRADPFGNMTSLENDGRFHTFCEAEATLPWCKAWHEGKNPVTNHVGEWAAHDAGTDTCKGGPYPDDKFCFTPIYNSNSSPWGW